MDKIIKILYFNFQNRIKEKFTYNLLSILSVFLIIFYIFFLNRLHTILVIILLSPYIIIANMSGINKNITFAVLKNFPVRLYDIMNILSFKFLFNNLITGLAAIFILRSFFNFSLIEWIFIYLTVSYISLIFYFLFQLKLRKLLNPDLIFAIAAAVVILISIFFLSLLYYVSEAVLILLSLGVTVIYHTAGLKIISSAVESNIEKILELNS